MLIDTVSIGIDVDMAPMLRGLKRAEAALKQSTARMSASAIPGGNGTHETLQSALPVFGAVERAGRRVQAILRDSLPASLRALGQGFSALKRVALDALARIADALFDMVLPGAGSLAGGGGAMAGLGRILPSLGGMLIGRLFDALPRFAGGGSVFPGRPALVGERGPEVLLPRQSASVVPLGVLSAPAPAVTVQQTINITTGVQQTVRAEIRSMLPQIKAETVSAVADASRRGGRLAGYIGSGAKR